MTILPNESAWRPADPRVDEARPAPAESTIARLTARCLEQLRPPSFEIVYPTIKSVRLLPMLWSGEIGYRPRSVTYCDGIDSPPLAFRAPTSDNLRLRLHMNCERIDPISRGVRCGACVYEGWEHDPGDEDRRGSDQFRREAFERLQDDHAVAMARGLWSAR